MDIYEESTELHRKLGGKLSINPKYEIKDRHDLSLVYTPGVARVCQEIAADVSLAYELTIKKNMVAIVTDGSAVLGLGNIGPEASLPVMEGKAMLFKEYVGIISGTGFAMAKIIGFSFMLPTISGMTIFPTLTPIKTSAQIIASCRDPETLLRLVILANRILVIFFWISVRSREIIPFESQIRISRTGVHTASS